jgi:poly-gamma-glutamate synthase PgsB/CapB
MIFTAILLAVLVLLGIREFRAHQKTIRLIPQRIHVNGTRGKSSVTRLITGGLQGGGIKTLGKTTGTMPCYITPQGRQVHILRVGKANIIEQVNITRRAVAYGVDALVMECMAVLPANQRMAERQIVHSTIGVITNVRADHLDEMGPSLEEVARSLSSTIPTGGTFFTSEQKYSAVFAGVARERGTAMHVVSSESVTDADMKGFSYLEHKDNVALALAVCLHMGVTRENALRGMQAVIPDPGVLRIFTLTQSDRRIGFVNAFAANDPDSYEVIWQLLRPFMTPGRQVFVIVNCRKDRIQRTESLAELISSKIAADHFILAGELTAALEHRSIALGLPSSKLSNLGDASAEEVFERVLSLTSQESLVIGIGNIVGFGEEIVAYFTNRGKEYAY